MRVWVGVAIGIVVVVLALLFFPLMQMQRDYRLANEQVTEARARVTELERVVANLKAELQSADQTRAQLQDRLDEANTEIQKLRADLEKATIAKGTNSPDQEGNSSSQPSSGWQPQ
jgi:septal ring factor EnvC (AmiA/AmiB activator)